MGAIIFRCCTKGIEFDSGFKATPTDVKLLPFGAEIRLCCRICGDFHAFKFIEARIDESHINKKR